MLVELRRWRKVGFRFDALAAYMMCEQHGVDLDEIEKIPQTEVRPSWIWNAHKSYCMRKYRRPRFTYNQMKRYIGTMQQRDYEKLLEAMMSKEESKKKVQNGQKCSLQDGNTE